MKSLIYGYGETGKSFERYLQKKNLEFKIFDKNIIEYNKDYYSDRDIKPEESIFLRLTIIPFGETNSPNLK